MGTVNFVNIPADLKESCRFCVWKKDKGKGRSARLTKVPYNPVTGQKAQSNNGETFSDFATAMKSFAMGGYDGIGIRVSSGIGAIDIDHCIREDGTLNDVAASVLGVFKDAYFERPRPAADFVGSSMWMRISFLIRRFITSIIGRMGWKCIFREQRTDL